MLRVCSPGVLSTQFSYRVQGVCILCYSNINDPTHSIVVKSVKIFKPEKTIEIQLVRLTEVCGKVLSLLKQHCYFPMLLMQTTKTAVCLQTKAIFQHLSGF